MRVPLYYRPGKLALLLAGLLFSISISAESNDNMGKHTAGNDAGVVAELMQDIGDHMVLMAGDLDYGTLNRQQQKNMAGHIRNMAIMMVDLSQMTEPGVMSEKKKHQDMKKMRKKMDEMMKEVSVGAMKPW